MGNELHHTTPGTAASGVTTWTFVYKAPATISGITFSVSANAVDGTGTAANDEVEARAIQTVFGDQAQQPWINSTKSIMGHTLGASGAIEAAVTALAVARGTVHGTITDDLIPDLNVPLETVRAPIATALSVSYGFGGHNGGLRFQRFRPDE